MAKNSNFTEVAVKIGAAMGKADRTAHKVAKAGVVPKTELAGISKEIMTLRRQLRKNTE